MPTLPKFIVHLDRLQEDINKTSLLMEKFSSDVMQAGYSTPGFSFLSQATSIRKLPLDFEAIIQKGIFEYGELDIFGNSYKGLNSYKYIEFAVDKTYNTFTAIRLLGDDKNESLEPIRFTLFGVANIQLTPTTVNILSDLRSLSDGVTDFFKIPGLSEQLRCGRDSNNLENIVNRAGGVIGLAAASLPGSGVQSELQWSDFLNLYVTPRVKTQPLASSDFRGEELKAFLGRFEQNTAKTDAEKREEEALWAGLDFKSTVARARNGEFEIVNASADILANPEGLAAKIQTLGDAYTFLMDKVSLGCLIKSAMECVIPPLTCKEILRGLRMENIEDKIRLAFPNQPRLTDKISTEIERIREEYEDEAEASDAFLDAIENFVDIEVICDIINFASGGGFQIPTIELPEFDIIDLFGSVEISIEDAILDALINAILEMILGILEDLASCDNLDAFIAGALNGNISSDAGLTGDLARLFTNPGELLDPETGAVAGSLDERWDKFVNTAAPLLEDAVNLEIDGGADALGGAVQLRAQIDAAGGLDGLREALEGNLGELGARAVLESFFQGQIDFTQLLYFQGGPGADSLNSLLAEIGRFELSDDGESFTLSRISDDQTVIVFSSLGAAPNGEERYGGKELANDMGRLLDDVVSIFSPADTLRLLSGEPRAKTVEIVQELIHTQYEKLSFIKRPDEVIRIFKVLGDTTGMSNIQNSLILASNTRRTREIPRKFCPEDDEAIQIQEEILKKKLPPEEVRELIDETIERRRKRYNELGDILKRIDEEDFTPAEVLEPIICGLNPDGTRPAVVEDALNITFNTMFEPTKMAFDREIPRYPNALSSEDKVSRKVPRTIKRKGNRPVFGASSDNLFGSLNDFLDSAGLENPFSDGDESEEIINPEWQRLLSQGMVPPEDDSGTKDYDVGPWADGEPIVVQDVVRRVGTNFKKGFTFEDAVELKNTSANEFEVVIKGSLPSQSPVNEFSPYPSESPKWNLSYKEKDNKLSLSLAASGFVYSQRLGRVQFSDNFFFSEDFDKTLALDVAERVEELNESVAGLNSKTNIFTALLSEKLFSSLRPDVISVFEEKRDEYFEDMYKDFVADFLSESGKRVAKNRLLRKVPDRSLNHLGPGTSDFGSKDEQETLIINLINFSATPTDEQKRCGADPHLLDLEFVKNIVKEEYDKDCESESQNNGISRSRSPINSSGYVGVVLTIIRLYVIEYVLRALFVLDEYGYKLDFAEDELLASYIAFRIKKDLERQGNLDGKARYYDAFETELKTAYEKLTENETFELPKELREPGSDGVPVELKVLVKEQMKSVLEKVSQIVGANPEKAGENVRLEMLENLPSIGVYSDFEVFSGQESDYTSNNQRFSKINLFEKPASESIPFPPFGLDNFTNQEVKGRYVLEKYVRVSLSTNSVLAQEQQANGLVGVVEFGNWQKFLNTILNEIQFRNLKVEELFDEPWKYGYRLVYVVPTTGVAQPKETVSLSGKTFNFGEFELPLKEEIVDKEKLFFALEAELQPPLVPEEVLGNLSPETEPVYLYKKFNSFLVSQTETDIEDFDILIDSHNKIESLFEEKYRSILLENLSNELDTRTLFDYCFFSKRLVTFMIIHSSLLVNSEDMKFLFEGTKNELKKLFNVLRNMGDYTSRSESQLLDGVPGNAGAYKADFDQIGSPSGPKAPDALYLHSITPILIMRGLAELLDPNIAITAKVVAAGNSGYLLPKYVKNDDGSVKLTESGAPKIQFSPVGVLNPNDGFECVLRSSDDELPSWVEDGTHVEWKAPEVPRIPGLPDLELPEPNQPLFIPRGPNGELYGLDRSANTENPDAIVASLPEFPGESVNLPYGLVSMALLPLQVFFPLLGTLTGPPYNTVFPIGLDFLRLEPLIYQLPNYKFAFDKTDTAEELKKVEGIDLGGARKIGCSDGSEPEEPSDISTPDSNTPPKSDNC